MIWPSVCHTVQLHTCVINYRLVRLRHIFRNNLLELVQVAISPILDEKNIIRNSHYYHYHCILDHHNGQHKLNFSRQTLLASQIFQEWMFHIHTLIALSNKLE